MNGLIMADMTKRLGEALFSTLKRNVTVTMREGDIPITATTTGSVAAVLSGDCDGSLDAQISNQSPRSDFIVNATETQRIDWIVGPIGEGEKSDDQTAEYDRDVRLRKVG